MGTATDYGWGDSRRASASGDAISAVVSTAQASITPSVSIGIDALFQNPIACIFCFPYCRSTSGRAMTGTIMDNNSSCPVGFRNAISTQSEPFGDDQIQPLVITEF